MIRINQDLSFNGMTVPSGSIILFDFGIVNMRLIDSQGQSYNEWNCSMSLRWYANLSAAADHTKDALGKPDEFKKMFVAKTIDNDTFDAAFSAEVNTNNIVQQWVIDSILENPAIEQENLEII